MAMRNAVTGIVRGNLISLDEPLPELDGRRVRLHLEPEEQPEAVVPADEQNRFWRVWAEKGPDGPIENEEGAEFP